MWHSVSGALSASAVADAKGIKLKEGKRPPFCVVYICGPPRTSVPTLCLWSFCRGRRLRRLRGKILHFVQNDMYKPEFCHSEPQAKNLRTAEDVGPYGKPFFTNASLSIGIIGYAQQIIYRF